jgi:DnaJ family protein C protein 3
VEDFKGALALDPNHLAHNVHLHLGLCKVLVKLGRGKDAISSCNEALNIDEELLDALVQVCWDFYATVYEVVCALMNHFSFIVRQDETNMFSLISCIVDSSALNGCFAFQRGEAKLLTEDWEGAVEDLKTAAQNSPQVSHNIEFF